MDWSDQRTRIRRFLRDPDGTIWGDAFLLRLYNDSQKDLQKKIGELRDMQYIRVPSLYAESFLYDWEWRETRNDVGYVYQALRYFDQADYVVTAQFESELVAGLPGTTSESVYQFTQPWEAFMDAVDSPANAPPLWIRDKFDEAVAVYWDREPIEAMTKKGISSDDSSWRTRQGEPQGYYRKDLLDNELYLYPIPSSVSWTDIEVAPAYNYSHTFDWEETDEYLSGEGNSLTYEDSTNTRWHTYRWEEYPQDPGGHFEYSDAASETWVDGDRADSEYGLAFFDSDNDDNQDFGLVISAESDVQDLTGGATDMADYENNLFAVYDKLPTDLVQDFDESDYPIYMRKYIEYGVLSAAHAANTDGKIQSLEEYWAWRKELAYRLLKKFRSKTRADRDYRLQTKDTPPLRTRRRPRLPDTYPAQW